MTERLDFLVRRDHITEHTLAAAAEPAPLAPGDVELALDLFGLTANNITYGVTGDRLAYWKFFPHPSPEWGRVPVWGFGVVTRSAHDGVAEGERLYGYYPMSTHVVVSPRRVDAAGFLDGAPHRRELSAVYNHYRRTVDDPSYLPDTEPEQVLLRPLFATSFLLDDLLTSEGSFGADSVLVSSASSKTAWGMAFLIARRRERELVGLTSARSVAAVARMGLYDRVLAYDDLPTLPARPTAYVDFSGSAPLRGAVHHHLGDALRADIAVGFTHWDSGAGERRLPGPPVTRFFAPARWKQRSDDWTPAGLAERLAEAWRAVLAEVRDPARGWLRVVRGRGAADIARAYDDLAAGRVPADEGHVLSFT